MRECWYASSTARLTPLRIKKTLQELDSSLDRKSRTRNKSSGSVDIRMQEKMMKLEVSV